jgi:hypothetical protein
MMPARLFEPIALARRRRGQRLPGQTVSSSSFRLPRQLGVTSCHRVPLSITLSTSARTSV